MHNQIWEEHLLNFVVNSLTDELPIDLTDNVKVSAEKLYEVFARGQQTGRSIINLMSVRRKRGKKGSKKCDRLDNEYTILTIDQTRQVLSTLMHAWFPEGEHPSLPVTNKWESIKLLGAVSDGGETF